MPNRYGPRADWWHVESGRRHGKILMPQAVKDQIGFYIDRFYRPSKAVTYIFDMEVVVVEDDTEYLRPLEFQISYGGLHCRETADAFDGGLTLQKILRAKKALEENMRRAPSATTEFPRMWVLIRDFQQQKENSNMSNTTTPEYSKNCAVKTLQQQLERAVANHSININEHQTAVANRDNRQKDADYWQEQQDESAKRIKELKAGLKKLGAGPRVTD